MHKDARSRRVANWKQAAGFALWQAGIIFGNTNPPISFRKTPKTTTYSAYDALGRVLTSNQSTAGTTYNFSYSYNLTDALISETYPSGRIVNICYDGANRESQVGGNCAAPGLPPYMTGGQYAAHGEFAQYQYGNGVQRNVGFNSRLQPLTLTDQLNTQTLFNLSLNWGTTKNNGNLQSATYANGGLTFTDNFSYDGVNRLLTANDSGGWSRTFTYDAFGNMTAAGNPGVTSLPFNGNNQIVGAPYDQAGNQLKVNGNSVAYDFENHIVDETDGVSQAIETYVYDGDGRRVEKYGPGGTPRTVFVYDALGRLAAEYHSTATVPSCITCYLSDDHLGTPRLITDSNGLVAERHDYLPFGEEVAAGTFGRNQTYGSTAGVISQKFTGKERDSESGLDYFGARYYGSALGRFTSPDPGNAGSHPSDPQSWNAYSYVRNNPLSLTDPTGFDYSICTNDGNGGQQCSYIANDQAAQEALANPGSGLSASNGNIYSTDDNGNQVQIGTYQHFLGPGDIASEGLQEDYGAELAGLGLVRGAGSLLAGAGASATSSSGVWALGWAARGGVIEQMLGANLPRSFPVIDVFEDGIATSIKSVDLTAASYQAPDVLASKLTGYVDKLSGFSGAALAGTEVSGAQITGRVLKLAVPEGVSSAQQAVISRVTAAAAQKGVQVVVVTVK